MSLLAPCSVSGRDGQRRSKVSRVTVDVLFCFAVRSAVRRRAGITGAPRTKDLSVSFSSTLVSPLRARAVRLGVWLMRRDYRRLEEVATVSNHRVRCFLLVVNRFIIFSFFQIYIFRPDPWYQAYRW